MPDLDSNLDTVRSTADPTVRLREGLPPGFRMRADAHYVEQLDAGVFGETARGETAQTVSPMTPGDAGGGFEVLAQSLRALVSASSLISSGNLLTQVVAGDLVRAEAGRAMRLLTSIRVLRDDIPARRSRVLARAIIERVARITTAECRLRGIEVAVRVASGLESAVQADEELLSSAIAGLVGASCALVGNTPGRPLTLGANLQDDGRVVAFTVRQGIVAVPDAWMSYAFEKAWPIGPGSAESLLALQAARRIALAHEGRVAAASVRDGTILTLTLPVFAREM